MPKRLDKARLATHLLRHLAVRGPSQAAELCDHLRISQPAFSRLTRAMGDALLVVGRARATRYAARRTLASVGNRVPVYEIGCGDVPTRLFVTLHLTEPEGLYVEPAEEQKEAPSGFFDDLPFFLHDLRPAGFLGRMVPRRHPELDLPADIRFWSADHCLRYFSHDGWNLPGNLVVGDPSFRLYLAHTRQPPDTVQNGDRRERYPEIAEDVLGSGAPGSSAAGEQPKFLATKMPEATHVIVKFSPPRDNPVAQRLADLLVCEHVALNTLRSHGQRAAESQLITSKGRVFLEVERFDRLAKHERRGVISLAALDAEWVGRMQSWTDTVEHLVRQGRMSEDMLREVAWLQLFGKLIANTDMHHGNLSCICRGATPIEIAPAYDMLPTLYAPVHGQLADRPFTPPLPSPRDAPMWEPVCASAVEFWQRCYEHSMVSRQFRSVARLNEQAVADIATAGALLPKP